MNINIKNNLTRDEEEVINLLQKVVKEMAPHVTLRFAGGWVRDKILGTPSDDIDVMVENISGKNFAELVSKNLKLKGPHVVKANPNASKHLETAGIAIPVSSGKVFDIDFAAARAEVYHDNSRIPDIVEASPEDDAFRRDLTINSLFYNLNTKEVEDFTGKGIVDLITRTIRTPLDPLKTFTDDPLRIFRTIRFAARYDGTIDEETRQAMSNPQLIAEIQKKISKERIKEELEKTLKGPNPVLGVQLLKDLGLFRAILDEAISGSKYESGLAELDMDQNNPHHQLTLWDHTVKVLENVFSMYEDAEPEKRLLLLLSALMHDLGKLYYKIQTKKDNKTGYAGHEDASAEIARLILSYLKFENKTIDQVSKMVEHHMYPHAFTRNNGYSKKAVRKFLRTMKKDSIEWIDVFNHAFADARSKGNDPVKEDVINKYEALKQEIIEVDLDLEKDVEKAKKFSTILNGHDVMQILGIAPGPQVKEVLVFLEDMQDENPRLTRDEAIKAIKEKFT